MNFMCKERSHSSFYAPSVFALVVVLCEFGVAAKVCVGICDDPLGLEDGSISDSMITASSTLNIRTTDNCQPYNARLNHVAADNKTVGGWCPSSSDRESPWLQVDLLHQVQIEGVIIQGSPDPLNTPDWDDWVTEYQVQYSDSQTDWTYVSEPSSTTAQTFQGNTDLTTPVKSLFKKPIYARYIRIRPTAYHVWPSMRIELIGCRASIFQITGCSSNISCLADAKSRFISVSWPALNRSASHLVLQYASHEPGDLFPVGNITKVKYTTLSQGGKTRSCDFFVTVTGVNITCPENITVSANLNNFAYVFWSPPVLSFSGVDQSVTVISDHDQGQRFDIGTTLVTNRVLETESQCQFSVTVKDTNPPRFFPACPAYIFRLVDISIPSVSVSWSAFNASDSSPPLLWNSSHQPGDVFQTGEDTVVTYEVTDQEGNSAYCNFTVTVTGVEFQCPANITVATDTGINTTSVSWMQPKVTFNSMNGQASTTENGSGFYDDEDYNYDGGDGSSDNRIDGSDVYQRDNRETGVRLQSDHQPGDLFSIGATQVIYQVQETEIECRFHVIVEDDEPPKVSGCPDDVIIPVTSSSQLVTHSWIPPILTDNSGQDVRVTFNCLPTTFSECNRAGNGSFSVGDTTVRYTARDMSGNRNVCAFTVTVTVVNIVCPANITAFASAGSTTTSVSWSEPVVTGWKGETNFTSNYSPGMTLPIGTYRVSYQQWFAEDDLPLECFFFVVVEGQCPAHNTSDGLRWPAAVAGSVTKSVKRCALTTANAGQPVAVRNCLREKAPLYFRWEEYANQSCGEVEKEVTLENVVEVEVSKANAVEVAGFLASQTSKSSEDAQDFEAVSSILENIAEAGSGNVKVAELVLDTVSNVILTVGRTTDTESQPTKIDAKSSSAIVQSVEAQISLTLQQEGQISIRQDSIHVEAVSLDSTLATEGFSFVSVKQSTTLDPRQGPLAHTDVKTLHSTVIPKDLDVLASAQLPSNIIGLLQSPNANKTSGQLQASFLIYADDTLFQSASLRKYRGENNSTRKVAGSVVSLTVENVELINLTEPLVIAFKEESSSVHCVSWNFELEDGVGDWTTAGCELVEAINDRVKCNCTHATNFAILVDVKGQAPDDENRSPSEKALDIISQVGCVFSIIALTITVVIYLTIRKLRGGKSRQIFIHFCFSLLMLYVIFLTGVDNAKGSGGGCVFVAALLHYLTLTTMMWMAVEARNMYISTVKVFPEDTRRYMLKASLIAWGSPLIVLTITLAAATHHYTNDHYCFLRPGLVLYIGLLTPIGLILIHNIVTFVLVMRSLLKVKEVSRSRQISKRLQNAVGISVLLGLTWCFGFLAINEAAFAFQLIFCLANSFQGVVVFILFCVRREEVRTALSPYMRRICCGRECHLPIMHPDKPTDAEMVSTTAHTQQSSGPTADLDMSITTPQ